MLSTKVLLSKISGTNLQSREHPQTVGIHFCFAECGEVATFVIQQYLSISIFCILEFGTISFSCNFFSLLLPCQVIFYDIWQRALIKYLESIQMCFLLDISITTTILSQLVYSMTFTKMSSFVMCFFLLFSLFKQY